MDLSYQQEELASYNLNCCKKNVIAKYFIIYKFLNHRDTYTKKMCFYLDNIRVALALSALNTNMKSNIPAFRLKKQH